MELTILYQTLACFVCGLATGSHLRREQTEDVVQNVWLAVVRSWPQFQGEGAEARLRRWLPRVVRSKVADLFCRESRQPRQSPSAGELEVAAAEENDPAVWLAKEEEREAVRAALARLRAEVAPCNWRLLSGRYVEGRSVKDLAVAEGLTQHEVSCRLHRMLEKLRARLVSAEEE
jgi:RNA polymerase sigma-70 factor (ECF subfamily)